MRRILVSGLAVALMSSLSVSSFAAFVSKSVANVPASISFSGDGTVSVTIALKNRTTNAVVTSLGWDAVTPGVTGWKAANAYIEMTSTITDARGGIRIYTDNKGTGVTPAYTGSNNPAGLVCAEDTAADPLPMCWRVVDASTTTLTIMQGATGFPDRLWSSELGSAYPCFVWMMDKNSTGFGTDYSVVKDGVAGIQHAEANWGMTPSPDFIYIGANFKNSYTPRSYSAAIRVEAFTE